MSWRQQVPVTIDSASLTVLIDAQVQRHPAGQVEIDETAEGGIGRVVFYTATASIKIIPDNNNHPIKWYFENKCADGAILVEVENEIHLHVIELKSKLTPDKWISARRQMQGMLYNSLAIAGSLSLKEPSFITCYVAFNTETISQFIKTNPIAQKMMVGADSSVKEIAGVSYQDFANLRLTLLDGQVVPVKLITRNNDGNASIDLRRE